MQQLDMFADAPVAPKAKREKPVNKSAWEIERDALAALRDDFRAGLPTDSNGLTEEYRSHLKQYHAAVVANDQEAQREIGNAMKAIAEHVEDHVELSNRCFYGAADWLQDRAASPDGKEPMFGQRGRLLLTIAGCETDFEYDGLFGICGGRAHVVHLDRPFYSETGFRSFQVCPMDRLIYAGDCSPSQWLVRVCEAQLSEGGKTKIKLANPPFGLVPFGQERHDDRLREKRAIDPVFQPGGYLHGVAA